MGIPHEMRADMSVTDLAFYILKSRGQNLHFKELISEIMRVKSISQENPGRLIAQMHTEINLDSRFIHHGSGEWGLREWQPRSSKVVRIRPESSSATTGRRADLRADDEDEDYEFDHDEEDEAAAEETEDAYEAEHDDLYGDDD